MSARAMAMPALRYARSTRTELVDAVRERGVGVGGAGHVGGDRGAADFVGDAARAVGVEVDAAHPHPLGGEAERSRAADARSGAGDERGAPLEFHGATLRRGSRPPQGPRVRSATRTGEPARLGSLALARARGQECALDRSAPSAVRPRQDSNLRTRWFEAVPVRRCRCGASAYRSAPSAGLEPAHTLVRGVRCRCGASAYRSAPSAGLEPAHTLVRGGADAGIGLQECALGRTRTCAHGSGGRCSIR